MNDFGMQDVYTLHIKKNRNNKLLTVSPNCESCLKGSIHVNTLQVRQFTQTGKLPGVCKNCNTQFLKICRNQIRNMNQNGNPTHICEICGKTFNHAGNYLKHKRLHEAKMKKINIMKSNLESSIEICENMIKNEPESEDSNLLDEKIESDKSFIVSQNSDPPYTCEMCHRSFQRYRFYLNHCETHAEKGIFICHICEKVCSTKIMLKNHMARCETRQPVYMCHYCEKCFDTKSSLKNHMETHLTSQETHLCKFCKKEFMIAEELEQHLLKHLNEHSNSQQDQEKFNHFCVDCGKGFVNLGHLKNHMQTHEGDVPFECKTCKKQFVQSHRLVKHLKNCKKDTTTYVCQICSKEFNYQKSFRKHKLLHKAASKLQYTQVSLEP